jgi:hypothetical protein
MIHLVLILNKVENHKLNIHSLYLVIRLQLNLDHSNMARRVLPEEEAEVAEGATMKREVNHLVQKM